MTAYRIKASMGGQQLDHVVEAANCNEAILNLSEQVDQGKVEITKDGFTGNTRVHITYEELKNESEKDRVVEKTSTP
jgi:hypothetical protein|tara:strand:+ start:8979 stop:9209 length:231 start_codon:yes stop_codon:yes gene_type:complete